MYNKVTNNPHEWITKKYCHWSLDVTYSLQELINHTVHITHRKKWPSLLDRLCVKYICNDCDLCHVNIWVGLWTHRDYLEGSFLYNRNVQLIYYFVCLIFTEKLISWAFSVFTVHSNIFKENTTTPSFLFFN
jgi:hypothetical protein